MVAGSKLGSIPLKISGDILSRLLLGQSGKIDLGRGLCVGYVVDNALDTKGV